MSPQILNSNLKGESQKYHFIKVEWQLIRVDKKIENS